METFIHESGNTPLKFDVILFRVKILCFKSISLKHGDPCLKMVLTIAIEISGYKILLI